MCRLGRLSRPEQGDPEHRAAHRPPRRLAALDGAAGRPRPPRPRRRPCSDGSPGGRPRRTGPPARRRPRRHQLGRVDPARDLVQVAGVDRDPGPREAQARVAGDVRVAERLEPGRDGLDPAALEEPVPVAGDQLARARTLAGGMACPIASATAPCSPNQAEARPCSSAIRSGWVRASSCRSRPAEQVVVAIPLALGVERDQEQAGPLELVERRVRARRP